MSKIHTAPNQITVHAVQMPKTHRIVHCVVASRDGRAIAYYPAEWHYRVPNKAGATIPSIADVQRDARWN